MKITIPAIPAGLHPAGCWRRTLAGLDTEERGGRVARGHFLGPEDVVDVPSGTLIVAVDKSTVGWANHYRTGEEYPMKDAVVTVYVARGEGLAPLWSRHYRQAKSAFGAATLKKIARLLDEHPPPAGPIAMLREARRPNAKAGTCRWCDGFVSVQLGHVTGHGDDVQVEHYEQCPPRIARDGQPCALCGVTVASRQAKSYLRRDGSGEWEARHDRLLHCESSRLPSFEELQAAAQKRRAEEAKAQQRREQDRARRQAKKKAKEAEQEAAHRAEQARIEGLATTSRVSRELYNKALSDHLRACLMEHTDTLEDGTTTMRWTVEEYHPGTGFNGEDYDPDPGTVRKHTRLADARRDYQSLMWEPTPPPRRPSGPRCDNCGAAGAHNERHDSSGIRGIVCNSCDRDEDVMLSFA
ncbi:hypothetical protein [Streptomyces nigrescens]|uniref:hypothetical protein n=1 Tax=Streptomyces nigrescens TaxID=1920 RepID=UPI0037019771